MKPALLQILKETSLGVKKKAQLPKETRKLQNEKLTGKGKHIVTDENHLHIKLVGVKKKVVKSSLSTIAVKGYTKQLDENII